MSQKINITLRKKSISKGLQSLYLDFYPPVRHAQTKQLTRREFLKLYIYEKPKSAVNQKQQFPGFENCYTITEIQQKFKISSGALYLLIQRRGIVKYAIEKFTYVAKQDIDIIFNAA